MSVAFHCENICRDLQLRAEAKVKAHGRLRQRTTTVGRDIQTLVLTLDAFRVNFGFVPNTLPSFGPLLSSLSEFLSSKCGYFYVQRAVARDALIMRLFDNNETFNFVSFVAVVVVVVVFN